MNDFFGNLSYTQKAILLRELKHPESSINVISGYAYIEGLIDTDSLSRSINLVLDSSDVIRERFSYFNNSDNKQYERPLIKFIDLSNNTNSNEEALKYIEKNSQTKFEPFSDPMQICIIKINEVKHYWYVKVHHILFDGYSMSLFFNKVSEFYTQSVDLFKKQDPVNNFEFSNFILEEQKYLNSNSYAEDKLFWSKKMPEAINAKMFETCFNLKVSESLNSNRKEISISRELFSKIEKFALVHYCSPLHYFIAIIYLLNKFYNNDPFLIGLPVYNRTNKKFKNTFGVFINTMPLSFNVNMDITFNELMQKIKLEVKENYRHQRFPFLNSHDELQANEFNVLFSYQKNSYNPKLGNANSTIKFMHNGNLMEDLQIHLLEYSLTEDLTLAFDYKNERFSEQIIDSLAKNLETFIEKAFLFSSSPLKEIIDFGLSDKNKILCEFNYTEIQFDESSTVISLFEKTAFEMPGQMALKFNELSYSYHELNCISNRFAHYLRETYSILPDDLIGVKLARNEWLVISILASLKAGAAYVPIDPDFPADRINFILNDSKCKILIDEKELDHFFQKKDLFSVNNLKSQNTGKDLAYIIYTSGTTGNPKGVMVEHKNLTSFLLNLSEQFKFKKNDKLGATTNFTFDISILELLGTLTMGVSVFLMDKTDPASIIEVIEKNKINLLQLTPSRLNQFLDYDPNLNSLNDLSCILIGGEPLREEQFLKLKKIKPVNIFNVYGPTETTIWSTSLNIHKNDCLTIGKPLLNENIYILDQALRMLPIGVAGEICIGGKGVARGYLNQPELNKEKFTTDPFIEGERIYKTGDLGRWLPDGNIEFIGRKDSQVKIRGYRLETAEIESILLEHNAIKKAIIIARADKFGDNLLIAFVIADRKILAGELREHLSGKLPVYVVPEYYVQLEHMPLTVSGKIDRNFLLNYKINEIYSETEFLGPRNETEEILVKIWKEVLDKERISVNDNFFHSGGQSLKITKLATLIHKNFGVQLELKQLFSNLILSDQAILIKHAKVTGFHKIVPVDKLEKFVLSSSQRRLWMLSQFKESNSAYNVSATFILKGNVKTKILNEAFSKLIERHEILRTYFITSNNGEPEQRILSAEEFSFIIDYKDRKKYERTHIIEEIVALRNKSFDLEKPLLFNAELIGLDNDQYFFTLVIHHIVCDGWSMQIITNELFALYEAACKGEGDKQILEPLKIQYKDYAYWQQNQLKNNVQNKSKQYWINQLAGELPVTELPGDYVRPAVKTYNGATVSRTLDHQLLASLKQFNEVTGSTLFMTLLAGIKALLYKYTSRHDLIVGTPIAGRVHSDIQNQVGFYVNTLALRTKIKNSGSFKDLLLSIKENSLLAYEHQNYPFDELINDLKLNHDLSRHPVFDIAVALDTNEVQDKISRSKLGDVEIAELNEIKLLTSKFDLFFSFIEMEKELQFKIEYNSDIYRETSVIRITEHLIAMFNAVLQHPEKDLDKIEFINVAEKNHLLDKLNGKKADLPGNKTVIDLFEDQVKQNPEALAISFHEKKISYKQLDDITNQLNFYINSNFNIQSNSRIGIKLHRNEEFIIAVMAILKSGAAYVPIDPEYPDERIDFIKKDSNCLLVIDHNFYQRFLIEKDDLPAARIPVKISGENLIYIIYTSGSTGIPKGIMMKHSVMLNLIDFHTKEFGKNEIKNVMQFASVSFDVSFQEIFSALLCGATLFPIEEEIKRDVIQLVDRIVQSKIDCLFFPTAYFKLLIQEKYFLNNINGIVNHIIVAGEQLVLNKVFIDYLINTNIELHNHYGPAETHVVTSMRLGKNNKKALKNVPAIGKPIQNTKIYILNANMQLLPLGAIGEIYIGGSCLSKGYLNQDDLTKEKFVTNPFNPNEILYRTGDQGKWLDDGNLEYIGRNDSQVKIRGYRIEIGEIESVLRLYPKIENCAVINKKENSGDNILIGYLVSPEKINVAEVKSFLSSKLPLFMIPSYFAQVDAIPLTVNGKLDKQRLPEFDLVQFLSDNEYVAPRNDIDEKLILIWEEILERKKIGIRNNFFELGGHSLKATRLVSRIHQEFNIKIDLQQVFQDPFIEGISDFIIAINAVEFGDKYNGETKEELFF